VPDHENRIYPPTLMADSTFVRMESERDTENVAITNLITSALRASAGCYITTDSTYMVALNEDDNDLSTIQADIVLGKGGLPFIAGECKLNTYKWTVLRRNLIDAYHHNRRDPNIKRAVRQLFSYMCAAGVEFGFMTTYGTTWFARRVRDRPDVLQITNGFSYNSANPSVAHCLWYLLNQPLYTFDELTRFVPYYSLEDSGEDKDGPSSDESSGSEFRGKRGRPDDDRDARGTGRRLRSESRKGTLEKIPQDQLEISEPPTDELMKPEKKGLWTPKHDENTKLQVHVQSLPEGQLWRIAGLWESLEELQGTVVPRIVSYGMFGDQPVIVWQEMDASISLPDLSLNERAEVLGLVRKIYRECMLAVELQGDDNIVRLPETGQLALFDLVDHVRDVSNRFEFLEVAKGVQRRLFGGRPEV